ncbi:MAG: hypothetical protein HY903_12055 [Deltaproteobacteria bacterium]|nr:hypothetical protein [Deltaproteobacteria bacterium]
MRLAGLIIAVGLFASPVTGRAACPKDAIPGAIAARIDRGAMGLLQGVLAAQLPSEIPVPQMPYTVMTCPSGFDNTVITPLSGTIHVTLRSIAVRLTSGAVEVDGTGDVEMVSELQMQLCAMPDATCPATLSAHGIEFHGRIEPSVSSCQPSLPVTVADVIVDPYSTAVQLDQCGLYDEVFQVVYDWLRTLILDLVTTKIEDALRTELPLFMETTVMGVVANGVELYGIRFDTAPEAIGIDPSAIVARFAANATPVAGVAPCLPPDSAIPNEATDQPAPVPSGGSMLQVALSQPFTERTVRAAWLSGWLCFDTRDYDLNLSEALAPLAPGATLSSTLVVAEPPAVDLSGSVDNHVKVSAEALFADVTLTAPGAPAAHIYAQMAATFGGRVSMDQSTQALTLEMTEVDTSALRVQAAAGAELIFSPATLQGVLQNFVLPTYAEKIGPLAISSGLFVTSAAAVRLAAITVRPDSVQANLDLWPIDRTDHVPPHTLVSKPPRQPSPARVSFEVASVDESTPPAFMRHEVLLDGVATTAAPTGGTLIVVSGVAPGSHLLVVTAIDLNDNRDPSPIKVHLVVDGTPPVLQIEQSPKGILSEGDTVIAFSAVDDLTPAALLVARFSVGVIQKNGGVDLPLFAGDLGRSRSLTLASASLPEDEVIRVTIFAADAAGNESEAVAAFGVDRHSTFSCAAARSPAAFLGLAAFLLALARARRAAGRRPA